MADNPQEPVYVRIPRASELRTEILIAKKNTYLMLYTTIQRLKNRRELYRKLRKASNLISDIFSLLKQLRALLPEPPAEINLREVRENEETQKTQTPTTELRELQKELAELETELKELLEAR